MLRVRVIKGLVKPLIHVAVKELLGVEPDIHPLEDAACAAAALLRRGLRHPGGHQARHVAPLIVDELASQAEVDDDAHLRGSGLAS